LAALWRAVDLTYTPDLIYELRPKAATARFVPAGAHKNRVRPFGGADAR